MTPGSLSHYTHLTVAEYDPGSLSHYTRLTVAEYDPWQPEPLHVLYTHLTVAEYDSWQPESCSLQLYPELLQV